VDKGKGETEAGKDRKKWEKVKKILSGPGVAKCLKEKKNKKNKTQKKKLEE